MTNLRFITYFITCERRAFSAHSLPPCQTDRARPTDQFEVLDLEKKKPFFGQTVTGNVNRGWGAACRVGSSVALPLPLAFRKIFNCAVGPTRDGREDRMIS